MAAVPIPRLPAVTDPALKELVRVLTITLNEHAQAINLISTGKFGQYSARSDAKPTHTGSTGDYVANTAQEVLGDVGSEYVVMGWVYADALWHDVTQLTDG